jgi:DNA-3-methyladenine glycosylase II
MSPALRRIETESDIEQALAALLAADPRLSTIAALAGPLPLRRRAGGFEGLASIITAQQISDAAAASIWTRLRAAVDPFTPEELLAVPAEALGKAGLSRPKIRTLLAVAGACRDELDLAAIAGMEAEHAIERLVRVRGIGPWTAEVYLLFCLGHADVFPAGDLALQSAAQHGLGLPERPSDKALRAMAVAWAPWRGVAARLFWAYYRARRTTARSAASARS